MTTKLRVLISQKESTMFSELFIDHYQKYSVSKKQGSYLIIAINK